jgi:hypothetical protein
MLFLCREKKINHTNAHELDKVQGESQPHNVQPPDKDVPGRQARLSHVPGRKGQPVAVRQVQKGVCKFQGAARAQKQGALVLGILLIIYNTDAGHSL